MSLSILQRRHLAKMARESWKDPEIRRKRLENRSANKQWQASRSTVARKAAKALHTKHKRVYKAGQKRSSETMKELYKNPEYKKKHAAGCAKNRRRPEWRENLRKGQAQWKKSPDYVNPSTHVKEPWKKVSKPEMKLAEELKKEGLKFTAQYKVPETWYTADFFFPEVNTIVEIDLHPSHYGELGDCRKKDRKRTKVLRGLGYKVIRVRRHHYKRGFEFVLGFILGQVQK